ncbi:hypothetical protein [Actinomadura sp. DC4]|uniref:hypothetical protein n=1 Tax=Actinomadura sp. DC4 TaxID=3055069 RepID=UPI0025B23AA5|nr:hypothetical protein [Actinomadura sp. DC4]MDN3359249.1 hypothetical protein [Actinomadura sp. DC4]
MKSRAIRDADVVIDGDAARITGTGAVARIGNGLGGPRPGDGTDEGGSGITAAFNAPLLGPPR